MWPTRLRGLLGGHLRGRCCHSVRTPPSSPQAGWAEPAGRAAPPGWPSRGSGWWCVCCRRRKTKGLRWRSRPPQTADSQPTEPKESSAVRLITHQFGRGHPILLDVSLQMSRQLQGHRTYFFPVGGFLMGWGTERSSTSTEVRQRALQR